MSMVQGVPPCPGRGRAGAGRAPGPCGGPARDSVPVWVAGNITSFESAEWGRPSAWPASCTATARSAASGSGKPVLVRSASEIVALRTRPSLVPGQIGLAGSVKSKWSIQRTTISASAVSDIGRSATPMPVFSHGRTRRARTPTSGADSPRGSAFDQAQTRGHSLDRASGGPLNRW